MTCRGKLNNAFRLLINDYVSYFGNDGTMQSRLQSDYFPQLILNILYPIPSYISQLPMTSLQSFTLLDQILHSFLEISG